jgi:hypothetical protein
MSETLTVDKRVAVAKDFVAASSPVTMATGARDFFNARRGAARRRGRNPDRHRQPSSVSSKGSSAPCRTSNAELQDVIASDDLVALRQVVSATHTGNLLGVEATGRPIKWDAVDIYRVTDDGKISEQWAFEDLAAILSQWEPSRSLGELSRGTNIDEGGAIDMSTQETNTQTPSGSADDLPDYAPVPDAAFGPALNEQGYYVGRVERNLYWVTDGVYQAAFLTTPDGVVLFDAPPTIGNNLQRAWTRSPPRTA